jgi:hypothetical protein
MKKFLFFLFLSICLLSPPAQAKIASAKLAVDVPAGIWKSMRLNNLPENSAVKAEIKSDGTITVSLMDQSNYEKYPGIKRPLFQSKVSDKLSFTVKIPSSGHYYVVFDNTSGVREVKLNVNIYGASGTDSVLLQNLLPEEQEKVVEKTLSKITTELSKLFIFKHFPVNAKICGKEEAFSDADGVVLCAEFVKKIHTFLGDKDKTINVLLFTIFHEVSHILLSQWGYPFYDNEEIADEFATVLLLMIGQKERLSTITEYFTASPSSNEVIVKAFRGDRHQLSIQRARNILSWMKDTKRLRRWRNFFVPHMQTNVLKHLKKSSPSPTDLALIEKELIARKRN